MVAPSSSAAARIAGYSSLFHRSNEPHLAESLEADHRRPRPDPRTRSDRGPLGTSQRRILDLGLHWRVDPAMGNNVLIAIAATHIRA